MKVKWFGITLAFLVVLSGVAIAAYHHAGEFDSDFFLQAYPDKAGTKLDHCALCHRGGSYEPRPGRIITMGSCQWCHYRTDYGNGSEEDYEDTLNEYGMDYKEAWQSVGRNPSAVAAIDGVDSDGDGYVNSVEIAADRYPGDAEDDPTKVEAPFRVYTRAQLEAMPAHTQFMMMNSSRGGTTGLDSYDEYTGVILQDLLEDAGIQPSSTSITAFAADGWSQFHPLEPASGEEMYHINGIYPEAGYYYRSEADYYINPDSGWVDYSAPGNVGRSNGDPIAVDGGLRAILAYRHNGTPLEIGQLDDSNKLQGEGPFRLVVPQVVPGPPDQPSSSANDDPEWYYHEEWDHNAGACSRTMTIIRVEPLPEGTTDINVYEAGWSYVDQEKIVIYGNILGDDSNGNGILDSEEGTDPNQDVDGDTIPDYQDSDTAQFRPPTGLERIVMHTSNGQLSDVQSLAANDASLSSTNRPSMDFPYGAIRFSIAGLTKGETVTVRLIFPQPVPTDARYFKIQSDGWHEMEFGSNDGDNEITLSLTDNDSLSDEDDTPGTILDPGALSTVTSGSGDEDEGSGSSSSCFIQSLSDF